MSGHIKRIWSKGPQAAVIDSSCKHIQKSPQGSIKPGIGPKVWTHTWFSSMPIFGRLWRKLVSGLFLAVVNSLGRRWLLVDASRPEFLFELAAMFGGCKDNWSRMFLAAVASSWAGFRSGARRALELASAHFALCTALTPAMLHCSSDPCNASTQLVNSFWCQQLRNSMPACSQPATENSVLTPKEAFAPFEVVKLTDNTG